jgi:6-pyruvoyl-tetrahydropterin synthase
MNLDVPEFTNLIPTTENMALVIAETLQRNWSKYIDEKNARLSRVHIQETGRNGFEVRMF